MRTFSETVSMLQDCLNAVKVNLDKVAMSGERKLSSLDRAIDEYTNMVEELCIHSRISLEAYKTTYDGSVLVINDIIISKIAGSIEITHDGWLHITLNTLLPSCKYKTSGYIGHTVSKLVCNFDEELPYFDSAFLAIVEYCNYKNHNALDNDNKGWKEIPNALKGRVIEDDNQFILSIGLFSKLSDEAKCEIYLMPSNEANIFMDLYVNDML